VWGGASEDERRALRRMRQELIKDCDEDGHKPGYS
jgi:hypothetical protein